MDLYQIHRWDYNTPIEETMEALHDVVKAGKARYIGASSMYTWQFQKALYTAERHGWTRFVSMQNHFSIYLLIGLILIVMSIALVNAKPKLLRKPIKAGANHAKL